MTIAQLDPPTDATPRSPTPAARITFRQPVSPTGFIDGAWWPRSLDLAAELPALMDVLWTAAREIDRISYNLDTWGLAPRRMQIEGRTVRLSGFATIDPFVVRLSDSWSADCIDVLVIGPDTSPAVAEQAFRIASQAESPYRSVEILRHANQSGPDAFSTQT